jgi:hypothetical protein
MGYIDRGWLWFGNQGLSYIQLGRFWQIGVFLNLIFWSLLVFRALWPTTVALWQATRQFWTGRIRLEHLIWAVGFGSASHFMGTKRSSSRRRKRSGGAGRMATADACRPSGATQLRRQAKGRQSCRACSPPHLVGRQVMRIALFADNPAAAKFEYAIGHARDAPL